MSAGATDVLAYLDWWDYMLWREQHAQDPEVEWQRDLSVNEMAEMAGVSAPLLKPGDLTGSEELNIALYWPADAPLWEQK